MHHILKIEAPYFESVLSGRKRFEIRHNDRGYNAGDTIQLREWDGYRHTGRDFNGIITYLTNYSQLPNWVVFGFKKKKATTHE